MSLDRCFVYKKEGKQIPTRSVIGVDTARQRKKGGAQVTRMQDKT